MGDKMENYIPEDIVSCRIRGGVDLNALPKRTGTYSFSSGREWPPSRKANAC
jgi:hypothetical protein